MANKPMERSILNQIERGMAVYDAQNQHIGTVDEVFFGDVSDVALSDPDTFVEQITSALWGVEMPEVLRKRLLSEGFIRIDSDGLLAADRYVPPDQIDAVTTGKVHLSATRDYLIKR